VLTDPKIESDTQHGDIRSLLSFLKKEKYAKNRHLSLQNLGSVCLHHEQFYLLTKKFPDTMEVKYSLSS
jgi:hypothetical protein